jgi:hypothetical protein
LTPQKKDLSKERTTSPPTSSPHTKKQSADESAREEISPSSKTDKKAKSALDLVPEAKEITDKMISALSEANKDWRQPKNLRASMMLQVHEMITTDKYDPKRIMHVFMWAVNDSFWLPLLYGNKTNPAKLLRQKFASFGLKSDEKAAASKVDRRLRDINGEVVDQYKDLMF